MYKTNGKSNGEIITSRRQHYANITLSDYLTNDDKLTIKKKQQLHSTYKKNTKYYDQNECASTNRVLIRIKVEEEVKWSLNQN